MIICFCFFCLFRVSFKFNEENKKIDINVFASIEKSGDTDFAQFLV